MPVIVDPVRLIFCLHYRIAELLRHGPRVGEAWSLFQLLPVFPKLRILLPPCVLWPSNGHEAEHTDCSKICDRETVLDEVAAFALLGPRIESPKAAFDFAHLTRYMSAGMMGRLVLKQ